MVFACASTTASCEVESWARREDEHTPSDRHGEGRVCRRGPHHGVGALRGQAPRPNPGPAELRRGRKCLPPSRRCRLPCDGLANHLETPCHHLHKPPLPSMGSKMMLSAPHDVSLVDRDPPAGNRVEPKVASVVVRAHERLPAPRSRGQGKAPSNGSQRGANCEARIIFEPTVCELAWNVLQHSKNNRWSPLVLQGGEGCVCWGPGAAPATDTPTAHRHAPETPQQ